MSQDRYENSERSEVRAFLPSGTRKALDVGCWKGAFGAGLKRELGAEVWGIEQDEAAATEASGRLDRVIVGDAVEKLQELRGAGFDAVTFNDVLEHLVRPELALDAAKGVLGPGGVVVVAIPNIRYFHEFMRIAVGKDFPMEESGIFDRTHLHFFTKLSIERLFREQGWEVQKLEGVNPTLSRKFQLLNRLTLNRLEDMRWLQYVVVARPAGGSS